MNKRGRVIVKIDNPVVEDEEEPNSTGKAVLIKDDGSEARGKGERCKGRG